MIDEQSRLHTMTAGGRHGPDVLANRRPDGVVVRSAQGDEYIQAFLSLTHCEALADQIMDVVVFTAQHESRHAAR